MAEKFFVLKNNGKVEFTSYAKTALRGKPGYVREAVKIAGELFYGEDVVLNLLGATSKNQTYRYLAQARNSEFKRRPIFV